MVFRLFLVLCFLASARVNATTPFTASGEKLSVIFKSSEIWSRVTGELKSIRFLGSKKNLSRYEFVTFEHTKKTKDGLKILKKPTECKFLVTIKNSGDPLAPMWIVDTVDFSTCPVGPPFM